MKPERETLKGTPLGDEREAYYLGPEVPFIAKAGAVQLEREVVHDRAVRARVWQVNDDGSETLLYERIDFE
jgi:hypothetical protein